MLSLRLFIFGPKYCVKKKSAHTLMNFISGSMKQERAKNTGSGEVVLGLKGLLKDA